MNITSRKSRRILGVSASALLVGITFIAGHSLQAATLSWDGSDATPNASLGGTGVWDLGTTPNWTNMDANEETPWFGGGDLASFGGTAGNVTLNADLGALGLQFLTSGYTIAGTGILDLGGNGIDASTLSAGVITIGNALNLTDNQRWNVGAGATLTTAGPITGGFQLITDGIGTVSVNGTTASVASLQANGGTLALTAPFNVTGGNAFFYVGNGGNNAGSNAAMATVRIAAGANLNVSGTLNDAGVIGRDGGSGTIIQTGGVFNYNPSNRNVLFIGATNNSSTKATYDLQGGSLNLNGKSLTLNLAVGTASSGALLQSGGSIDNASELKLGDFNGNSAALATYSLRAGSLNLTGSGANVYNGSGGSGAAVIDIDGLNITTGTSALPVPNGINFDVANTNRQIGTSGNGRITSFNVGNNASGSFALVSGVTLRTRSLNLGNGVSNGTFELNGGTLDVAYRITKSGTGNGILNFNGGTLQPASSNDAFIGSNITTRVKAGGATIHSNGFNITVASALTEDGSSPGGGLVKSGTGVLTLTGANSYTGATTLNGGTLNVSSAESLGAASNGLVFNGGALQISGTTLNSFGSHAVSFAAGQTVTLNISDPANSFTANAVLNQTTGGLNKLGDGTLVLNGANSYSGATTVSAGTLRLDFSGATTPRLNSASSLVLNGAAFSMVGTNVAGQSSSQTLNGVILNPGASVITNTAGAPGLDSTLILGGLFRTGATLDFSLPTSGAITTTALNTNTILGYATIGGTTWATGSATGNPAAVRELAAYTSSMTAGNTPSSYLNADIDVNSSQTPMGVIAPNSLRFNTAAPQTLTLTANGNSLTAGGILVTAAAGANASVITGGTLAGANGRDLVIIQNNGAGSLEIGSQIVNNGAATALVKSGPGTLVLTNAANAYTGKTYLNGGITTISADSSLGIVPGSVVADQLTFNGGTLQLGGAFNLAANRGITLLSRGGTLDTHGNESLYAGILSGAGTLVKTGAGTLTLSNTSSTFTGDLVIDNGAVSVQGARNDASVPASSLGNLTVAGRKIRINSGGSLLFAGNDSIGAANNAQSTEIVINGGTVSRSGAFFVTLPNVTLMNGGTLTGGNGNPNIDFQSYSLGGNVTVSGSSGSTMTTTGTSNIAVHLGARTVFQVASTGGTAPDLGISVPLANRPGGASGGFIKSGAGTMHLASANTYSGLTTVSEGALTIQNSSALGTTAAGTVVAAGASLQIQGDTAVPAEPLALSGSGIAAGGALRSLAGLNSYSGLIELKGPARINTDSGALAINHPGTITGEGIGITVGGAGNTTIAGVIGTGSGTLTKDGNGILTLTGANTFTGTTTVAAGKLVVTGSLNINGAVSVGGTLAGTGSVGAINVANGGAIEVGSNGIGQLTATGLSFADNGSMHFGGLAGYASTAGLQINGALNAFGAANSVTITIANLAGVTTGSTYKLIRYSGSPGGTGFGAFKLATLPSRTTGVLLDQPGAIDLQITGTDFLKWTGSGSLAWDTATPNWKLNSNNGATTFIDGTDAVVFDDSASPANTNVLLSATNVSPSTATFLNSVNHYTLSGARAIAGGGAVIKSGTAPLSINNANTYTGGTTLNAGTLALNHASAIGIGPLTIHGGALDNTSAANVVLSTNNPQIWAGDFAFTGTRNLDLGVGAVTLSTSPTVNVNAGILSIGGAVSGLFGITKTGAGALLLAGNNNHTGGTTLAAGSLLLKNPNALGAGIFTIAGGTLDNVTGAAMTLGTNNAQTWAGDFAFSGTHDLNLGTGPVALVGNPVVSVDAGNLTVGGVVSGIDFGFTKAGVGTMTLRANNTYSGPTVIQGGSLVISGGASLYAGGSQAGTIMVQNGATLVFDRTDTFGNAGSNSQVVVTVEGGGLVTGSNGTFNPLNHLIMNGGTILAPAGIPTGGAFNLQRLVTVGGTMSSMLETSGATNAFISIGQENTNNLTVFDVSDVTSDAGPDLIVNTAFGNNFGATSGLIKQGGGTMSLNAVSTYTGVTMVNEGTLVVTGSIAGSEVSVEADGAVLSGTGMTGSLTAFAGTVFPGISGIGTLRTGSLRLFSDTTLQIEVTDAIRYNALDVTGSVSLSDATLTLGGSYLAALTGDLFFILVNDGGMEDPIVGTFSGFADGASLFSSAGQEYVISYFGDAGSNSFTGGNDLVLMAVPEPGSFGLLMATLGAGLCLRRRRRQG